MKNTILIFAILAILIIAGCVSQTTSSIEKERDKITKEQTDRIVDEEIEKRTQAETDRITEEITKKETARITKEITQKEIERITKERTEEFTKDLGGTTPTGKAVACDSTPTKRQFTNEPYYTGPLLDAHVHMPVFSQAVSTVAIQSGFQDMPAFDSELSSDYIVCLFDNEGIQQTFGFYLAPNVVMTQSVQGVASIEKRHPGKIAAFYMPTPIASLNPNASEVEKIITDNPGLFKGIGEIKFAFSEVPNANAEGSEYLALYDIANRHNLIVMMHPNSDKEAVDRILTKYPKVKFLIHGGEAESWITDLMKSHKNVYYSVDASITSLYGFSAEHQAKSPSKEKWLASMKEHFDSKLDKATTQWKPAIEQYPDRFMWGTDRWYRYQFDEEVGAVVEEFGRSFIGELDPAVQEKFAYKNAEGLLEKS